MPIIEVHDLVKCYGEGAGVNGLSFSVDEGEIFGILGPNGAGKTTTVECVEGLRVPDRGSIRVCGLDPQRDERELRQVVGAQLQESALPDKLEVQEALALYSSFYRQPADWRDLAALLDLTDKLGTQYRRLSGGQKQRLSIALALLGSPKVAVLDELTTGLDPRTRRDVWELIESIRDRGVTILLVTHFMEEAERLCDRLTVIDAGTIVATDTPAGLISCLGAEQRVRFRPSSTLDLAALTALPEVSSAHWSGDEMVVTGGDSLLLGVATLLAAHRVTPSGLRVEQATLDDAFVALTGRTTES